MTFGESISICFKKYATFEGRASRSEYWWFVLFEVIVLIVAQLIHQYVYAIAALGFLLPALAAGARRLHDIGKSGWWLLLNIVPLVGPLVLLYFAVKDSQPGSNQYGPNPKAVPVV